MIAQRSQTVQHCVSLATLTKPLASALLQQPDKRVKIDPCSLKYIPKIRCEMISCVDEKVTGVWCL